MLGISTPKGVNTRRKTLNQNESVSSARRTSTRLSLTVQKSVQETPKTPLVLLREDDEETKTPNKKLPNFLDPVMEKIKRDLNSPSALARMRGQRAMKSPGYRKATYEIFDVPREEQEIITEEERQPYKPKTLREIFDSCRIYVEVRTGDDNRSAGIKSKLLSDGIKVNEKLYKDTTHVIFKDGLLSTYKQAKKLNIPVTTILWIEACKAQRRLVDASKFLISNLDRYENPELYPRMRRQKSMQPEISKQIILKPKAITQNPDPTTLDDTSDETLNETENKTLRESTGMEITLKENLQSSQGSSEVKISTQFKFSIRSEERPLNNRRLTTFTPRPMEQTKCVNFTQKGLFNSVDRRRTVFEFSKASPATPASVDVKSVQFNSANRIAGNTRRSIMDISMNLFELNCKALEEKKEVKQTDSKDSLRAFPSVSTVPSSSSLESLQNHIITQIEKIVAPGPIRKRKLFNAENLDDTLTEAKENVDETLKNETNKKLKLDTSVAKAAKPTKAVRQKPASAAKVDRRKTISYFKTEKPAPALPKPKMIPKYVVCTNMSATEKKEMTAIIKKLGGHVESEVSTKTTHVVSPTVERTMNILRGVIRACYVVNMKWVKDSEKTGKFLDGSFYLLPVCSALKINERKVLGKRYCNSTFAHMGPFYLQQETIDNEKKVGYLKEIIENCGGKMTTNRSDAKFIVSDHPILVTLFHKPTVVISTYIFDCAMQNRVLPPAKYLPKNK